MSPPSWISLPPPTHSHPSRLLQSPHMSFPSHTEIPIGYLFTHVSVYAAIPLSIYLTLSLFSPTLVHKSDLYVCCPLLLYGQYHPSRFHIYVLTYAVSLARAILAHCSRPNWNITSSEKAPQPHQGDVITVCPRKLLSLALMSSAACTWWFSLSFLVLVGDQLQGLQYNNF